MIKEPDTDLRVLFEYVLSNYRQSRGLHRTPRKDLPVCQTITKIADTIQHGLHSMGFDFRKYGVVKLNLTIMTGTKEDARRSLYDMTQGRHPAIFDHRGDELGGSNRPSTIRLYSSDPILSESDFIDGDRSYWSRKVNTLLSNFAASDFPAMKRIIVERLRRIECEQGSQPPSRDGM